MIRRLAPAFVALVLLAGCGGSEGDGGGGATTAGQSLPHVLSFPPAKSSVRYPDGFHTIGNGGPTASARVIEKGEDQCTAAVVGPLPDLHTEAQLEDYLRHPPDGVPGPPAEVRPEAGASVQGATGIRDDVGPRKITLIGGLFQSAGNGLALNCSVPGDAADEFDRTIYRPMAATVTIPVDADNAAIQGKLFAIDGVERAGVRTSTVAGPASTVVQLVSGEGTSADQAQQITAAALLTVAQAAPKQRGGVNLLAGSAVAGIGTLNADGSGQITTPPGAVQDFTSQSALEKLAG